MRNTQAAIDLCFEPSEYFLELVASANENQGKKIDHHIEFYVADLLKVFVASVNLYGIDAESGASLKGSPVLYEKLAKAVETEGPSIQVERFRYLGDFALYMSGFFGESLKSKLVGSRYYIDMGRSAYKNAGKLTSVNSLRSLFQDLCDGFTPIVHILSEVSDRTGFSRDKSLLSLYENWMETGNVHDLKSLFDMGLNPISLQSSSKEDPEEN